MVVANVVLTSLLAAAAIAAAILAWHNLIILRRQPKLNMYLSLLRELSEGEARKNRDLVFTELDPNKPNLQAIKDNIIEEFTSKNRSEVRHINEAVEETIARLDRVGFFLLRGDPSL
jgi:hypothetical protein